MHRIARWALTAPGRVVACSLLVLIGAAIYGVPAAGGLSAAGFGDPTAESTRANRVLTDALGTGGVPLIFTVTAADGAYSPGARAAGADIVARAEAGAGVADVRSPWTSTPAAAAPLISADGRTGLIVVDFRGGEDTSPAFARTIADDVAADVAPRHQDVEVLAGGPAMIFAEINSQTQRDALVTEAIALPLSFLVLVWVFKGWLAAAVPVAVAGLTIVASMATLRVIALFTDVSIFALNLTTALGLALAIDYTLLIVSRFRDEVAAGTPRDEALLTTMATAGRTVVFSALTVALSMSTMALFPMYFLKSFAYAGVAAVALCALAALVVTPAAIVLLGPRIAASPGPPPRHSAAPPRSVEQGFWYRWSKGVARRALPLGVAGTLLLVFLGLPFLGVAWGVPDDRVLPETASAHRVGDLLRSQFPGAESTVTIVVPRADAPTAVTPQEVGRYAAEVSRLPDVSAVSSPAGTWAGGRRMGPPSGPVDQSGRVVIVTVSSTAPVSSEASDRQLDLIDQVRGPDERAVEVTGTAQISRDTVRSITDRLPVVLAAIAVITFLLLFVLTGSVLLPLKALVLNALSLTAAFGALVWIFQDGNLGALGTTPTGTLVVNMPVLLFCIAFGLSMDYEVFLLARIREHWLASGRTRADNDESVALGLAHTARVVTAAALIMSISFAALIAAEVSFMRMFGLGLTLAVLVDATLVRMVLLPAFMHLMGRWNWWAPAPLSRVHAAAGQRWGAPESERFLERRA